MSKTPPAAGRAFVFRLDPHSGVPVYRQLMDQITGGMASGALAPGEQLPTVRQMAADLAINPNTVARAWRELEIRGLLETQQGTGTFIGRPKAGRDEVERRRQLAQLVSDFVARAGAAGFTVADLMEQLRGRGIPLTAETRRRGDRAENVIRTKKAKT
jgi:GntR family transcriptional regulator